MSDFKSWRRKLGVVTLLMACLFEVGWVRSRYTHDTIKIQTAQSLYIIDSHQGTLVVCRVSIANMPAYLGSPSDVIATNMQIRQS
ncbi:hypothetical protein [Schlesneria paludicola]|uniref:hypothetical protein n=1 Tax=Schlesneria paludicola TaxID=360056 RepID=UPI00029A59D3|nr:hypothetical protein [Schlesneria paludicola]